MRMVLLVGPTWLADGRVDVGRAGGPDVRAQRSFRPADFGGEQTRRPRTRSRPTLPAMRRTRRMTFSTHNLIRSYASGRIAASRKPGWELAGREGDETETRSDRGGPVGKLDTRPGVVGLGLSWVSRCWLAESRSARTRVGR